MTVSAFTEANGKPNPYDQVFDFRRWCESKGYACPYREEAIALALGLTRPVELLEAAGTCKPGQTAARSGCTPASKAAASKPTKPAAKPAKASPKIQAAADKVAKIGSKVAAAKKKLAGLKAELKAAKVDMAKLKASTIKSRPAFTAASVALADEVKSIYHPGAKPEQIAGAVAKLQKGKRSDAVAAAQAIGMKVPPSMGKAKVIEGIQRRIEERVGAKQKMDAIHVAPVAPGEYAASKVRPTSFKPKSTKPAGALGEIADHINSLPKDQASVSEKSGAARMGMLSDALKSKGRLSPELVFQTSRYAAGTADVRPEFKKALTDGLREYMKGADAETIDHFKKRWADPVNAQLKAPEVLS